jgi:hypothetical protein
MVCKEAMFASGACFPSCSLWVHCGCVAVQHGLFDQYTWLLVFGPRLESQNGELMTRLDLMAGEHARHLTLFRFRHSCSAVEMLRKWHSLPRLETRTKESDVYASIWVSNPHAQ